MTLDLVPELCSVKGVVVISQTKSECILKIPRDFVFETLESINKLVDIEDFEISNISLEEVVESHWLECISDTVKKTPLCKTLLLSSKRIVEGNKVIVLNGYDKVTDHLKSKCGEKSIEGSIEAIFGLKCKVEIRFDPSMEVIIDYAEKEKNERKLLNQALQAKTLEAQKAGNGLKESGKTEEKKPAEKKTYEKKENTYKREPKSENCIYGRNISIEAIPIKEINETSGYVAVLG